jgi:hypothetical protein
MAANTDSLSSAMVSMSTPVSDRWAAIFLVACTPLMSGRCRSITTTSGSSAAAALTALIIVGSQGRNGWAAIAMAAAAADVPSGSPHRA